MIGLLNSKEVYINTIKQGGKTYTTSSKFQVCINNKHYTGWRAVLVMWFTPALVVISIVAIIIFCMAKGGVI